MLPNNDGQFGTNFWYKQVLKKRHSTLDELVSILSEFLNLHVTSLLKLLHLGNGFLTLKDLSLKMVPIREPFFARSGS